MKQPLGMNKILAAHQGGVAHIDASLVSEIQSRKKGFFRRLWEMRAH